MADQESEAVLGDRDGDIDRELDRRIKNAATVIKFPRPWTAKTKNYLPAQPSGADCVRARTSVASVAATNGAIRAIVIIAGLLISAGTANAIECQSSPPSNKGHWAWRLIDDRKCWYAGEPGMDKTKLRWAANAHRAPEPAPRATPEPAPRATPEPALRTAPEPALRTAPEPALRTAPEPALGTAPEPAPGTAPEPAPRTGPEPAPRATPEPAPRATPEPALRTAPEPALRTAPEPAPRTGPEPAPRTGPEPAPRATPEPVEPNTLQQAPRPQPTMLAASHTPPRAHASASGAALIGILIFVLATLYTIGAWAFSFGKHLPQSRSQRTAHVPPDVPKPQPGQIESQPRVSSQYSPLLPIDVSRSARRRRTTEDIMAWR
jgi:hypothetical protein